MTHSPRRWRPARHPILALGLVVAFTATAMEPTPTQSAISAQEPADSARPSNVQRPAQVQEQARPNIVVIMADDMREDDLRWMPRTRQLIADHGARFTNSFAPYPLCCPARASFLTGQYAHNHGVWSHRPPYGFPAFDDASTLPVWLEDAGYNTLFLGKYLNRYGKSPLPDGGPSANYVPPGWTDWHAALDGGMPFDDPRNGGTYRYWDMTLNVNGFPEPHQGEYSTRLIGRESIELIDQYAPQSKPFFLWSSYVAPHKGLPVEPDDPPKISRKDGETVKIATPAVPKEVRGRFDDRITKPAGLPSERNVSDKPAFIRNRPPVSKPERKAMLEAARQRAESLSVLDRQVAQTIEALRDTGELKNTIVMFTSDNGYFQGEHRMRQGKTLPYEPSLSIPLLVRGPKIPHGVKRSAPFLMIDFAPTVLRAAGARPRASIDGQSRLGVARAGGTGWKQPVLTETGPHQNVDADKPFSVGVRTPWFLYVEHLSGAKELYDMRRDPDQLTSRIGWPKYADEQRQMAKILRDLRHCKGKECRRPLSSWRPNQSRFGPVGPGAN